MALYLDYRPTSLAEIKGNEDVVSALEGMLSKPDKFPHVILFHGATGCGKTTLARIIAKEMGCFGSDLMEIDFADMRGVDTVRDIKKSINYKPLQSSCRFWILDEVQKMTGDAQNAFLKTLEDTPKHVYFVLCTTDPGKLISTIKGRCSQFQVKPLNDKQLLRLLKNTVKAEGEELEQEIYDQIIQDSQGHPRNALQILEQVLNVPEDKRLRIAQQTAVVQSQSIELSRALIKRSNWKVVSEILRGLKDQDPESIRRQVLGYAQAVLLNKDDPAAAAIMEEFLENTYNSGFAQIVYACYCIIKG